MFVSSYLGLTIWNSSTDPYDTDQLATNWAIVDQHDHTPGKGSPITTASLADGSITAPKFAPGVLPEVVTEQLIGPDQILDGAIGHDQIANGAVGPDQLGSLPAARIYSSTPQAVSSGATGTLTYSTLDFDTDGITTLPGTTMEVQTGGLYILNAEVIFTSSSYGYSYTTYSIIGSLSVNGSVIAQESCVPGTDLATSGGLGASVPSFIVGTHQRLSPGDTIVVKVHPVSSAISVTYRALEIAFVGP